MADERLDEMRNCLTWFANECFPNHVRNHNKLQLSVVATRGINNSFDVKLRADHDVLAAMDAAAKFYAEEIDPQIRLNFC